MSNPSSNDWKLKGNAALAQKDYETAVAMYTKAIEADESNTAAMSNRALVYLNLEK